MREEINRASLLGINLIVIHPGFHLGEGEERGLNNIAEGFEEVHDLLDKFNLYIAFETTVCRGTSIGYKFEHIAAIFELLKNTSYFRVCIDTCHVFVSGYDLRYDEEYEKTFQKFDNLIGCNYVAVIHLNDTKGSIGSCIDRHEHIGKGKLGLDAFRYILHDQRWKDLPVFIETPKDNGLLSDKENLQILRSLI